MPDSFKCLLEVYEVVLEILLLFNVFSDEYSAFEDLFHFAAPSAKASLFFGQDLLRLAFKSVQNDFKHDFAWMANEAYGPVVLALTKVIFLWQWNNKGLGPFVWPFHGLLDPLTHQGKGSDCHLTAILQ